MKTYESIQETLSFYGVNCKESFYISSGAQIDNFPNKPFRMDYYAVCICTAGSIHLTLNKNERLVRKATILISGPSTVVQFRKKSPAFRVKLLFFDKNFLLKNISNPFIIEKFNLFLDGSYTLTDLATLDYKNILSLIYYLERKAYVNGIFTNEIIRSLIFNILLELAEILSKNDDRTPLIFKHNICLKFEELVRKEFIKHKNVDFYSQQLCVSSKYLIEIIKKNSGKTPHEFIDDMLLNEALVLLGNQALSISEIAFKLNFQSISSFSRFFKKKTTYAPSEYRRKI